jgi:hypothetical protein
MADVFVGSPLVRFNAGGLWVAERWEISPLSPARLRRVIAGGRRLRGRTGCCRANSSNRMFRASIVRRRRLAASGTERSDGHLPVIIRRCAAVEAGADVDAGASARPDGTALSDKASSRLRSRLHHRRLQTSLIDTRRTDGKVRQEYVASLGSAGFGVLTFWARMRSFSRLAELLARRCFQRSRDLLAMGSQDEPAAIGSPRAADERDQHALFEPSQCA